MGRSHMNAMILKLRHGAHLSHSDEERLRALAGDGGIQECGYAQNCVEACPKQIPLTNAISDVGRDVVVQKIKDFLRG